MPMSTSGFGTETKRHLRNFTNSSVVVHIINNSPSLH